MRFDSGSIPSIPFVPRTSLLRTARICDATNSVQRLLYSTVYQEELKGGNSLSFFLEHQGRALVLITTERVALAR